MTRRRRCGTPRAAPRSSRSRGTRSGLFGVVQPRRVADRHRASGRDGEGVGRPERRRGPHAQGAELRFVHFGVVQPRRVADVTAAGLRATGLDGESLGRPERPRDPHAQGAQLVRLISASFSPDGSRIVTASEDKTAKVWDAQTGAEVLTLKGHTSRVYSAAFSPDGSRIVTGSDDKRRRCGTPRPAPRSSRSRGTTISGHRRCSAPTGRGSSPASSDGTAKVWDAQTGAEVLTLKGHSQVCLRGRSARTGRGSSPAVMTRRRRCGTPRAAPRSSRSKGTRGAGRILAVFSPDGSRIVTGSLDGTVKVWDAKNGVEVLSSKDNLRRLGALETKPPA